MVKKYTCDFSDNIRGIHELMSMEEYKRDISTLNEKDWEDFAFRLDRGEPITRNELIETGRLFPTNEEAISMNLYLPNLVAQNTDLMGEEYLTYALKSVCLALARTGVYGEPQVIHDFMNLGVLYILYGLRHSEVLGQRFGI